MAPRVGTSVVCEEIARKQYDIIIVGGGLSGLVLASRLSEDESKSVLLLEAGSSHIGDPRVDTPGLMATLWEDPEYDWGFWCEPQQHLDGREIPQPRGKLLGGSSAVNYTAILYPNRRDFDAWTALGNSGWTFKDMAPYFRKFHTYEAGSDATQELLGLKAYIQTASQGQDGPLSITYTDTYGPFNKAWNEVFAAFNMTDSLDPIDCEKLGAFTPSNSIEQRSKKRSYAASAYYTDAVASRSNLEVVTEVLATRILFDDGRDEAVPVARGVRIQARSGHTTDLAGSQVILSAGAIQSPQLLELSGIGSRSVLDRCGIPSLVDNDGVGENLQDHSFASLSFEVASGHVSGDVLREAAIVEILLKQYQETQSGPFSGMPMSMAYLPAVDANGPMDASRLASLVEGAFPGASSPIQQGLAAQYAQIHSMLLDPTVSIFQSGILASQMHFNATKTSMGQVMAKVLPGNYVSFTAGLNHPLSRGSVHIRSDEMSAAPKIDPNYFSHPLDVELTARCLQFVHRVAHQSPMAEVLQPTSRLPPDVDLSDLDVAKKVAKERLYTTFHPSCSCAMLPRHLGGVVDDRCNVYGVKGLRVVDASIFPMITQGNIQATVYAVAERAADLIKEDWS